MTDLTQRPLTLGQPGGLKLRYGENGWQGADLFTQFSDDPLELGKFVLEAGDIPSATNLTDIDRGVHTMIHSTAALEQNGAHHRDVAVALKHGNCCGAGAGQSQYFALRRMVDGDRQAIMGGVVVCNFNIDADTAELLLTYNAGNNKRLLDVVVAPSFTRLAIEKLNWRKGNKCRLLSNPALLDAGKEQLNCALKTRPVRKGHLVQDADDCVLDLMDPNIKVYGPDNDWCHEDLAFASGICRTSNSNTVTLVYDGMLIGQGTGQTRRDRAARLAVEIALENGHKRKDNSNMRLPEGTVAVSDSFFPFPDGPQLLIDAGVEAIFSTTGSVRDKEVQDTCRKAGVTLYQLPDKEARMFFGH